MSEFSTVIVDEDASEQHEQLGSKRKFWYRDGEQRMLLKIEDRGTGEDWAEVVACELCKRIGLPHVEYQLATLRKRDGEELPAVVCANMTPPPLQLFLGNQMLLAIDKSYPESQRFNVSEHTVAAVSKALGPVLPVTSGWPAVAAGGGTALETFTGYLMLDAWIANQDRHHENWGAIFDWTQVTQTGRIDPYLAPTYDHGAALARNVPDAKKKEGLVSKDRNRQVAAFVRKARSAIFASKTDKKAMFTLDAARAFGRLAPQAWAEYRQRILGVPRGELESIVARIPDRRISPVGRDFTVELLIENQRRLEAMPEP